jgi:hypothetical protein
MFQAVSGRVSVGKEDKDVREVPASGRAKGEQKSNRYTLQTKIAATPTKQTAGTRVNRYRKRPYKNQILRSANQDEITLCLCGLCDSVANPKQAKGEEKSNRDNSTFKNRRNSLAPKEKTFSNRDKNTSSGSPGFRHPSPLTGDRLRNGPGRNRNILEEKNGEEEQAEERGRKNRRGNGKSRPQGSSGGEGRSDGEKGIGGNFRSGGRAEEAVGEDGEKIEEGAGVSAFAEGFGTTQQDGGQARHGGRAAFARSASARQWEKRHPGAGPPEGGRYKGKKARCSKPYS